MALLLEEANTRLASAFKNGRFGHAYLLSGPSGSGKRELARRLAAMLLQCDEGVLEMHPDFHEARPESKSRRIVIEQIRDMERALRMHSLQGGRKVAVIHEADRLQPQAANAFLKTLEEPPDGSHVFLLSSLPEAMLETILSRCIDVPLRLTEGRPSTESERYLRTLFSELLAERGISPVNAAFTFSRNFQEVLGQERQKIAEEFEEELKREKDHYKQMTDARWLKEREDQNKAMTEASVSRERSRLLQVVVDAHGEALRLQGQAGAAQDNAVAATLARTLSTKLLIQRLEVLERMRSALERGAHEALTLEVGFLEMFSLTE